MDVSTIVDMLSVCKQLTGFEIHGKLDEKCLCSKLAYNSLVKMMKVMGVNCPFKILPKFVTTLQDRIKFHSF